MAEDIRIEITGDNKDIKKVIKASEKLVKRFEKANARSTQRRVMGEKRAAASIQRAEERKNRRLEAMDRRLSRKRARVRLRQMKENIRIAKREAAAEERIKKRSAAKIKKLAFIGKAGVAGVAAAVAAVAGGVAVSEGKKILSFDLQLTRASAQAGVSVKRQMELREAIMQTSLAYGTSREEILAGISAIVDKSGDLEFGAYMMEKMSKASIALGVNIGDLGLFATSLKTGLGATNKEAAEFLEILAAQADIGAITIREFASLGPKLFGAAAAAGIRTKQGLIDFGALTQIAGRTGSPEEAITATVNLMTELSKRHKQIKAKTGFSVFGKTGELKNVSKIIKAIITRTKGSQKLLYELGFGKRAIKPLQLIAAAYRNAKTEAEKFVVFDNLIKQGSTATESIAAKHARVSQTSAVAFKKLGTAVTALADSTLAPIISDIAKSLHKLLSDPKGLADLKETFESIGAALKLAYNIGTIGPKAVGKAAEIAEKGAVGVDKWIQERLDKNREKNREKQVRFGLSPGALDKLDVINNIKIIKEEKAEIITELKNPKTGESYTKHTLMEIN